MIMVLLRLDIPKWSRAESEDWKVKYVSMYTAIYIVPAEYIARGL